MGDWLHIAVWGVVCSLTSRRDLALENIALRQQLMVLRRQTAKVRLREGDRLFWVWLRRVWPGWRGALVLVQPATVVGWHRRGFRTYWRWKSRARGGRPRIDPSVQNLIRHMWKSNPTWGAPRIQAELHKLGIDVSDSTVRRYRPSGLRPPSQTWRSFLENHRADIAAMDFFIVPTATFRVLYVLLIMSHDRRRILHFNVTTSPSARWTARQVVEAFPYDTQPRFLLHDRDSIFGGSFARRVGSMGIEEVVTAPGSPWQNPYCERLIGSIEGSASTTSSCAVNGISYDSFTATHPTTMRRERTARWTATAPIPDPLNQSGWAMWSPRRWSADSITDTDASSRPSLLGCSKPLHRPVHSTGRPTFALHAPGVAGARRLRPSPPASWPPSQATCVGHRGIDGPTCCPERFSLPTAGHSGDTQVVGPQGNPGWFKSISPNAPTIQADGEFRVHALAEPLSAKRLQDRHHRVGAVHCIEV